VVTLEIFLRKITNEARTFGLLFSSEKFMYWSCQKNGLGHILGDFGPHFGQFWATFWAIFALHHLATLVLQKSPTNETPLEGVSVCIHLNQQKTSLTTFAIQCKGF
jgi:hypothetical protein